MHFFTSREDPKSCRALSRDKPLSRDFLIFLRFTTKNAIAYYLGGTLSREYYGSILLRVACMNYDHNIYSILYSFLEITLLSYSNALRVHL